MEILLKDFLIQRLRNLMSKKFLRIGIKSNVEDFPLDNINPMFGIMNGQNSLKIMKSLRNGMSQIT